jgi:preprotein translocase subunit SecY
VANFINIDWVRNAAQMMSPGNWLYELFYVAFIVFFVISTRL